MNDSGRKPRLLLVEANREDAFLIKKMLRDTGIELDVTVAEDGEKAMDILDRANGDHKRPIVFVILGIDLPKIDGFEVLSYMKKMHGMKGLPVVVMTRSINNAERDRVLLMGATHYLVKPSSYREFTAMVEWMRGALGIAVCEMLPRPRSNGSGPSRSQLFRHRQALLQYLGSAQPAFMPEVKLNGELFRQRHVLLDLPQPIIDEQDPGVAVEHLPQIPVEVIPSSSKFGIWSRIFFSNHSRFIMAK